MKFERILVAVDDSPVAAHAAEVGAAIASALSAKLAFLLVVDPSAVAAPGGGAPQEQLVAEAERDGRQLLAGFCQRMSAEAVPLQFVRTGTPAAEILKAAAEWPADMLVVGSHGRSGVSRAVIGSVAETVTRHAACPVLVVRAKV